ncbi:MAG: hypothetical protein WKF35_07450 [Ferruginibacter sp.]
MKFEDNPRLFLLLILQSLSVILIWMITHVMTGIYLGLGFYETVPGWKNYLYYLFLLVTFYLLVKYIKRKWRT